MATKHMWGGFDFLINGIPHSFKKNIVALIKTCDICYISFPNNRSINL